MKRLFFAKVMGGGAVVLGFFDGLSVLLHTNSGTNTGIEQSDAAYSVEDIKNLTDDKVEAEFGKKGEPL